MCVYTTKSPLDCVSCPAVEPEHRSTSVDLCNSASSTAATSYLLEVVVIVCLRVSRRFAIMVFFKLGFRVDNVNTVIISKMARKFSYLSLNVCISYVVTIIVHPIFSTLSLFV